MPSAGVGDSIAGKALVTKAWDLQNMCKKLSFYNPGVTETQSSDCHTNSQAHTQNATPGTAQIIICKAILCDITAIRKGSL